MDINDFKGINYFRYFGPLLYIFSWTGMVLSPEFATYLYREYGFIMLIYLLVKTVYQTVLTTNFVLKSNAVLEKVIKNEKNTSLPVGQPMQQIYHAFIIPSYKEDIEIIAETLEVLAQHKRSTYSYLIFLAMEGHEQKSDEKALKLMERFNSKFRYIDFTRHQLREFQAKGKASNVSWCAEHMAEKFKNLMINDDDVFVTVMDADSWAPNAYFDEVEEHIYNHLDKRHTFIYQPPQIYSRNNMEVPIFVRTYDDMYSSFHAASITAFCGITLSYSNYSISYNLLKRIGFWDTNEEAIAEDAHLCLKAHFKTNGQTSTVPIFAPFNQLSIQTGNGYCEDIKAKFWQLERHARSLLEIGYSTLMFFKYSMTFKSLGVILVLLDFFLMPILIPYAVMSIFFEDQVLHWAAPEGILAPVSFFAVINFCNVLAVFMAIIYDYNKRKASKILYGIESPSIWRVIEGPLFMLVNAIFVLTITYATSAFMGLKSGQQYVVADKVVSSSNKISIQSAPTTPKLQQTQEQKATLLKV